MVAIDFHSMENTMEFNCLIANILQNILFCDQKKKEMHKGLEQHESEYIFGCLFKISSNVSK